MIEPATGSLGVYGIDGDVNDFVEAQDVAPYLDGDRTLRVVARRPPRSNRG